MTEQDYLRMTNMLDALIEQQARAEARQSKTDEQLARLAEQTGRNTEGIAGLLALREMHEEEITALQRETSEKFNIVADRFKDTDERINALINVVERYLTRGE